MGASAAWARVASVTRNRDFKRRVRQRMRGTGERYTAAHAALSPEPVDERRTSLDEGARMTTSDRPFGFAACSDRVRQAVALAEHVAVRQQADAVEPVHLLYAATASGGSASQVFGDASVAPESVTRAVADMEAGVTPDPRRPYAKDTKKALEHAFLNAYADTERDGRVETDDLLAGLIDGGDSAVTSLLGEHGHDPEQLRATLPVVDPAARAAALAVLTAKS